jgi:hypothetical protein
MYTESEVIIISSGKMGRPTDNPKSAAIGLRLDEDTSAILFEYCKQKKVTRAEAIRHGIRKLASELEQKE